MDKGETQACRWIDDDAKMMQNDTDYICQEKKDEEEENSLSLKFA